MLSYRAWQHGLGLLAVPLYRERDAGTKHVLLNGISGNFCLDEEEGIPLVDRCAVAWSSNIGHHLTTTPNYVEVVRWDKPDSAERYTVASIQNNLEDFHRYLEKSAPESNNSVVGHALGVFRSIRSGLREGATGFSALEAFLYLLGCVASGTEPGKDLPADWPLPETAKTVFQNLSLADQGYFFDRLSGNIGSFRMLRPDFALLLRHASGALFQEAHAQVVLPDENWLPGIGPLDAVLNRRSLGITDGAFFTPPSIARTLAEEALREFPHASEEHITIFDPACGSGELLKEALRILEIKNFRGHVTIQGWDVSQAAVDIASFSLGWEAASWNGKVAVRIECINSVTAVHWPVNVQFVLMNPPFKSWQDMNAEEQQAVQEQLSGLQTNKPNLASVFIMRASQALSANGVLASVAPRSFFDASSSRKLRESLLETISPVVIVNLANPSLYTHAMVQSGLFVGKRTTDRQQTTLVWTDPRPGSVGEALRGLRKFQLDASVAVSDDGFSVYRDGSPSDSRSWLPRPYSGWALGRFLQERGGLINAKSLFDIKQGVRMGSDAFLVTKAFVEQLESQERAYFRPAVTNANLLDGRLSNDTFIFYPYTDGLSRINTEDDLASAVPKYYQEYLVPNRTELEGRKSLVKAGQPWWGLIWPREWQYSVTPKLVTKYFGRAGSFAWDARGDFVVVVGHGWIPRESRKHWQHISSDDYALALVAIFATPLGENLLSQHSVQVGGGQWDLSGKYVGDLPLLAPVASNARALRDLAAWGAKISFGEMVDLEQLMELVCGAYGVPLNAFNS
ncbi:N-6 DNA methylase [Paraburkholderia fungorum]|uniref:site-specific DNA-methyltransferase (adenine-specific) n=1 Tax=Paraburkholderia fungorum TaxID=134537 RepID=A0AAP5Q8N6_9BURK|nr:N-6 DNA methylase [Paraburkholderia fungorum]MDT8837632.1 N-6 DNA methylase [Paraburkholderia fungorum]PRZ47741.1 N-6 DNA methylase [Paraburkholderia fungorum]